MVFIVEGGLSMQNKNGFLKNFGRICLILCFALLSGFIFGRDLSTADASTGKMTKL